MIEIQKQIEIEFLKEKTYTEINDMFRELNTKLNDAKKEAEELRNAMVIVKENSLNPAHTMTMLGLEETVDANYNLAVKVLGH